MKHFNLKEALNGAPIQTRSGLSAEFFAYDRKRKYPFLASIDNGRYKTVVSFSNEGEQFFGTDTAYDLFMKEDTPAEEMKKAARYWYSQRVMRGDVYFFDVFDVEEKAKKLAEAALSGVHRYTPIELRVIREYEKEKVKKEIDWEQRRYEIAREQMAHGVIPRMAVNDADCLIKALKGETE